MVFVTSFAPKGALSLEWSSGGYKHLAPDGVKKNGRNAGRAAAAFTFVLLSPRLPPKLHHLQKLLSSKSERCV
jgi:hypothetical protein